MKPPGRAIEHLWHRTCAIPPLPLSTKVERGRGEVSPAAYAYSTFTT
jgi:hypothetical protein